MQDCDAYRQVSDACPFGDRLCTCSSRTAALSTVPSSSACAVHFCTWLSALQHQQESWLARYLHPLNSDLAPGWPARGCQHRNGEHKIAYASAEDRPSREVTAGCPTQCAQQQCALCNKEPPNFPTSAGRKSQFTDAQMNATRSSLITPSNVLRIDSNTRTARPYLTDACLRVKYTGLHSIAGCA